MDLPSQILLYIAGATSVTGILVNGIRTAVVLPPVVSFLGACVLGFLFVTLFAIANGVTMTVPLWAGAIIAGVMVGGASAGSNAVHARTLPTTDGAASPSVTVSSVADELERRLRETPAEPDPPPWLPPTPPRQPDSRLSNPLAGSG